MARYPDGVADWDRIAADAAAEAGVAEAELLGDYLPGLAEACATGDRLGRHQLAGFRALGARAADGGVALSALIDLYLSATWRAWRRLPPVAGDDPEAVRVAGEIVLHAVDDAVAAAADGFQVARRAAVRLAESQRREFVDDLLTGAGDPVGILARAEQFGVDLTGRHAVTVVRGPRPYLDTSPRVSQAAAAVSATPRELLVTTRQGELVAILPAAADPPAVRDDERAGVGRAHPGVAGVAQSYTEARDALDLADRLGLPDRVVRADQLLVFRVLLRDRDAMEELIAAVLDPLRSARGGPGPLLDTIEAYVVTGANTAAAARRLHLSVRAVTYRLARIHELTGHDPTDPQDRFVLHAALLGARALGWPAEVAGIRQG
jgi:PucR C-terminal helix-turn-helix domain/GGDEF-like domain